MRVLHVTSTFPRTTQDPSGHYLLTLMRALAEAGDSVVVLAPHEAGLPPVEVLDGVEVHRFRYAPAALEQLGGRGGLLAATRRSFRMLLVPGFVASMSVETARLARRWRPDVVHAHWWLPGGLAAAMATRAVGVPMVLTLHGSDVGLVRSTFVRRLARRVCGDAAAVTAVSDALAAQAREAMRVSKLHVIPMPLDLPEALPPPIAPPPLRLAGVGRLAPEKGWDVLLRAVDLLDTPVEVDIVGDGPQRHSLLALSRTSSINVRWHGALPPRAAREVMARAHAVVVPSRSEGLGLVAVEALALGRPVVASAVGGLVSVVEDGVDGILVPPDDPVALAAALGRLPLPAPRGEAVRRHRPPIVARAYRDLYASVLAPLQERRPAPAG